MKQLRKSGRVVTFIAAATCIAMIPEAMTAIGPTESDEPARSLAVDKVFAIEALGIVDTLKVVGTSFDSGDVMSLTLGGKALDIERSSGTEITAKLPAGLEPGHYELAITVTDEVNRLVQAMAIEIPLAVRGSTGDEKSRRLLWSSAENPLDVGSAGAAKALSGYQRRVFNLQCPNDSFCWVRVACPAGYFVSGGGMTISGSNTTAAYLNESFPFSNTSWEARTLNLSGSSRTATAHAVCVR